MSDDPATAAGQALTEMLKGFPASGPVSLELSNGSAAGGGESSYALIVKEVYTRNWDPAGAGVTSDEGTTKVAVAIASNGQVLSARITGPSGDVPLDRSVQQTLERVRLIGPFEPGCQEKQRSYTIHFNFRDARLAR